MSTQDGEEREEEDQDGNVDEEESDNEEHVWFDCAWCKDIFLEERKRDQHMAVW